MNERKSSHATGKPQLPPFAPSRLRVRHSCSGLALEGQVARRPDPCHSFSSSPSQTVIPDPKDSTPRCGDSSTDQAHRRTRIVHLSPSPHRGSGQHFPPRRRRSAALDRLLHKATVVNFRGESYRLRERRKAGATDPLLANPQPKDNRPAS